MPRYAHIIGRDVVNVIEIDPASDWRPEGGYVIASETAQIGWAYDGKVFTDPTPPISEEPKPREPTEIEILRERIATLEAKLSPIEEDVAALKADSREDAAPT